MWTGDDSLINLALRHFQTHMSAGILVTTDFFGKSVIMTEFRQYPWSGFRRLQYQQAAKLQTIRYQHGCEG